MRSIFNSWKKLNNKDAKPLKTRLGIKPGLYHFRRETPKEKTRLHLRMDPDSHGTLVINANQILHLNPTAAQICYYHLNGLNTLEIKKRMDQTWEDGKDRITSDIEKITRDIKSFIHSNGKPIIPASEVEINAPYSLHPLAPYRMDLALTYRCNNDCPHCYNARTRNYPELSTEKWKTILDRLFELSIPHVIFTGGEPTLREDLAILIHHAESLGLITGLNTNARRLSNPEYVKELVDAGLDHIQITLESHNPQIHDEMVNSSGAWRQTVAGIKNALAGSLFVMTNTTMLQNNYREMDQTLDFLAQLGVPTIGLNALIYAGKGKDVGTGLAEDQLEPLLSTAREKTEQNGQRLIWYTPTLYCRFNPLEHDLGVKGCTAALYNMCLEPDGGVLPCQSYYQQLGSILSDPWEKIWEHELAVRLRNREYLPQKCRSCHLAEECGAGCPLSLADKKDLIEPILPPSI